MISASALLGAGLVAMLATQCSAFIRMECGSGLVQQRADPVVSPGKVSGHVHTITGGNGFGFAMDYNQARRSQCSSCAIKQDLSNYWTPKLYYKAQNGTFVDVPQIGSSAGGPGGMIIYYQQRGPAARNKTLKAHPAGFRMVAGDPLRRSYGGDGDFSAQAVSYACLDYAGPPSAPTHGFPKRNCPNGVRAQIFFPSCWDGKNLDSPNHKSHMSYPESGHYDNGPCPASHPVQLISIFYEVIWQTNLFANQWYGTSQPFVWAQGDSSGYGFHGDFVNGWDVDTLQAITDECTNNSGRLDDCRYTTTDKRFDGAQMRNCKIPPSVNEPVTGRLAALPGCNPVTGEGARAVPVSNCTVKSVIGAPATYFTDLTKSKGWRYIGCGTDRYNSRTLKATSQNRQDMTVERCVDYCTSKGFSYAGLEYSSECYCDNVLPDDRKPQEGILGQCNMACKGNTTQFCGGPNALSLYQKCNGACTNVGFSLV